jgi:Protein of unknown function (DUF2877)
VNPHRFTSHSLTAPVRALGETPRLGTVLGSSAAAAYLAFGDSVVALTARSVPPMPNGAAVIEGHGLNAFEPGARVHLSAEGVRTSRAEVAWREADLVDLGVSSNESYDAGAVAHRGRDLLRALGQDADPVAAIAGARPELVAGEGLEGVRLLSKGLTLGEPDVVARAARILTGRGPGLTPDGDDLLAAAAAATVAFEGPAGFRPTTGLRGALLADDLEERTSSLSASLLRLAVEGQVIDPVRALLDLGAERAVWTRALARLERIGHGTGGTYARGCALTAHAFAQTTGVTDLQREEKN